jgi:type IV pilus assembly protein PilX
VRIPTSSLRRVQRGAVLFIALIVLVAMSLAGLALMRGVDTGTLIASNLAFKQGATMAGDLGVERARTWLIANSGATLDNDQPAVTDGTGYWATWQTNVDLIGDDPAKPDFDWGTAVDAGTDAAGNQVSYVIQRLCYGSGPPSSTGGPCVSSTIATSSAPSSKGAAQVGSLAFTAQTSAFYRVTVKVTGPRNTVSYVQAVVY